LPWPGLPVDRWPVAACWTAGLLSVLSVLSVGGGAIIRGHALPRTGGHGEPGSSAARRLAMVMPALIHATQPEPKPWAAG